MSRSRLSLGARSSFNPPNDNSFTYHNISQDNSSIHSRKLSYDAYKQDQREDSTHHMRKRQPSYMGDCSMISRHQDYQRSSVNPEVLMNENAELKLQRDQYLSQLNKNEEMLWKAREVISHLKSDIHLESLSKNLMNQASFASSNLKAPKNENEGSERISANKNEQKIKDLTKKLQAKENQIQELNQVISKLNVDNHGLQSKLTKAIAKIKELKTINEASTRTDLSHSDLSQRPTAKNNDLQKKLDTTIQYNFDLFNNYTKMMKENSELQAKLFAMEQDFGKLKGENYEKQANHSIIKETEYKIENIEHNISKIEETSLILPQLEQRFESLQKLQKEKIKVIKSAVQLLQDEVNKTLQSVGRNDRQILSDLDNSQIMNSVTLRGETRRLNFQDLLDSIKNDELREIVEQLQPNKLIKPLVQKLMKNVYELFMEKVHYKTTRNLASLEQKVKKLENINTSRNIKLNPFQNQNLNRSKSTNVRRQSSIPSYGNVNEGNKENSFFNILNTSNSRF